MKGTNDSFILTLVRAAFSVLFHFACPASHDQVMSFVSLHGWVIFKFVIQIRNIVPPQIYLNIYCNIPKGKQQKINHVYYTTAGEYHREHNRSFV